MIHRPPGALIACHRPGDDPLCAAVCGAVQVRRVTDDAEIDRFPAHGDREIFVFDFSPDGRYLATTHFPGYALTVRDVDQRLDGDRGPRAGAGSGCPLQSGQPAYRFWRARTGKHVVYDLAHGQTVPVMARTGRSGRPGLPTRRGGDRDLV